MMTSSASLKFATIVLALWFLFILIRIWQSRRVGRGVFDQKREEGKLVQGVDYPTFAKAWFGYYGPRQSLFMFGAAVSTIGVWWLVFERLWAPIEAMFYGIDSIQRIEGIDPAALYTILIIISAFLVIVFTTGAVVYLAMRAHYTTLSDPPEKLYIL